MIIRWYTVIRVIVIGKKSVLANKKKKKSSRALLNARLISWLNFFHFWPKVQKLYADYCRLHDCKNIGFHFTGTVSYLFPLEIDCFHAPGLDQNMWIMVILPFLIQGGYLLTLHVCQLGHTTLKQHYHNNTVALACNCKHRHSHLYDIFPQISNEGTCSLDK